MISRQSATWQTSAFIGYSYVVTFSSTLFIRYINIQDTTYKFYDKYCSFTTYTLWLCTAKTHVLYWSWCSVYLYKWYEAMWNTKYTVSLAMRGYQNTRNTTAHLDIHMVHKNSCPLRNETLAIETTVRHLTNWDITSTCGTKTHYNAHPFMACISGLAPLCNSSSTMSLSPLSTASCRAVAPHESIAFTSAPRSETKQAGNTHT